MNKFETVTTHGVVEFGVKIYNYRGETRYRAYLCNNAYGFWAVQVSREYFDNWDDAAALAKSYCEDFRRNRAYRTSPGIKYVSVPKK